MGKRYHMVNQNSLQVYHYPIQFQETVVKRLCDKKAYLKHPCFYFFPHRMQVRPMWIELCSEVSMYPQSSLQPLC